MKITASIISIIAALVSLVSFLNTDKYVSGSLRYFLFIMKSIWFEVLLILIVSLLVRFNKPIKDFITKKIKSFDFDSDNKIALDRIYKFSSFLLITIVFLISYNDIYSIGKARYLYYKKSLVLR